MRQRCITGLDGRGLPTGGEDWPDDVFRPHAPPRHLLSAFLRHSADARAQSTWDTATLDDRIRILSASGPTAGCSLVAPLTFQGAYYSDREWTAAGRWRLGLPSVGPCGSCQNATLSADKCGEWLNEHGDHAVDCPCGPLRTFRHDDLADVYADVLEESGAIARREIFVPELSGSKEAWLDVWGYGLPEAPDLLLDVTVRHPRASRYRPASEREAGAACAKAVTEKADRYKAAAGRTVWTIPHETWGRLGDGAEEFLQLCNAAAARRAWRRGQVHQQMLRR